MGPKEANSSGDSFFDVPLARRAEAASEAVLRRKELTARKILLEGLQNLREPWARRSLDPGSGESSRTRRRINSVSLFILFYVILFYFSFHFEICKQSEFELKFEF